MHINPEPPFGIPNSAFPPIFAATSVAAAQLVDVVVAAQAQGKVAFDAIDPQVKNLIFASGLARDEASRPGLQTEQGRLVAMANSAWAFERLGDALSQQGDAKLADMFYRLAYQTDLIAVAGVARGIRLSCEDALADLLARSQRLRRIRDAALAVKMPRRKGRR